MPTVTRYQNLNMSLWQGNYLYGQITLRLSRQHANFVMLKCVYHPHMILQAHVEDNHLNSHPTVGISKQQRREVIAGGKHYYGPQGTHGADGRDGTPGPQVRESSSTMYHMQ